MRFSVRRYVIPTVVTALVLSSASVLAPDGLLILDPTEHLGKAGDLFTPGADGVYSRRREAEARHFMPTRMDL